MSLDVLLSATLFLQNMYPTRSRVRLLQTPVMLYDSRDSEPKKLGLAIYCPNVPRPHYSLYDPNDSDNADLYSNDWLGRLVYVDVDKYSNDQARLTPLFVAAAGLYLAADVTDDIDSFGCQSSSPIVTIEELEISLDPPSVRVRELADPAGEGFVILAVLPKTQIVKDCADSSPLPMNVIEFRVVPHNDRHRIVTEWKDEYENSKQYSEANDCKASAQQKRQRVQQHISRIAGTAAVFNAPKGSGEELPSGTGSGTLEERT